MRQRRSPDRERTDAEASLRAAYDEHAGELFAFAERSLGDAELAEEAVQETFLRVWRHRLGDGPIRAHLFAVCRTVVTGLARAQHVRPPPGDPGLERLLLGMQVEEALRRLSPDHSRVLVEVYMRARPAAEVAAEFQLPPGTVQNRAYYALKALRLALEEMGVHR